MMFWLGSDVRAGTVLALGVSMGLGVEMTNGALDLL